ncbi:MAG TPA: Fe-S cluster assembly protein SufB [Acidimicrobiia bacterium]
MVPESIKETYEKLGIPQAERKYLAGVTAQYECLRGDVRVYTTARGLVPIKDVTPGDQVFSLDESTGELTVAPVKHSAQTDVRQTYRVTIGSRFERVIHATDNHPLLVLAEARRPGAPRARHTEWKTVGELSVGDLVAVARDLPDFGESHALMPHRESTAAFPSETSRDLMWLLGLWYGSGHTAADHPTHLVEFMIPEAQGVLRAQALRVIESLFDGGATTTDSARIAVDSEALVEWLEINGINGDVLTKRLPVWVYGLPAGERLAFLGGCIDAGGQVEAADRTSSESLLDDVAELALLCGLRMAGPWRFEHPTVSLAAHETKTLGFARVVAVEEADVAPVYDIEIDGPHNFIAEGIVVHNSEVVYHRNREDLEGLGVLFMDTDTALREHPDIVKQYFGTIIPPNDNKFAALNSAVWSGGSFIYVPPGVHVDQPLQAYFRINAENMGQFERTLIIVDEGAYCHYVEGCSAPVYSSDSLHSAVVEIVVKEGGRCRYTTIQNWSNNVYNLVTKRAAAYKNATMEWIDGNLGSKLTMKYPAVWLMEEGAHGEVLSIAFAGKGQHLDAGAKIVHAAPNTTSLITSKSISKDGGRGGYRGLVRVESGAENARSFVRCDALILDEDSRSDTYPYMEIEESNTQIGHEATVSKVGDEQLFYLMSRGLTEAEATAMIVAGFIEPIVKELPMEYAVELNRLIELQMEGSVG